MEHKGDRVKNTDTSILELSLNKFLCYVFNPLLGEAVLCCGGASCLAGICSQLLYSFCGIFCHIKFFMCQSVVEKEFLLSRVFWFLMAFFVSLLFWMCSFAMHGSFLSLVAAHNWLAFKTFLIEYIDGCLPQQCDSGMALLHAERPDLGSVKGSAKLCMAPVRHFHAVGAFCVYSVFYLFILPCCFGSKTAGPLCTDCSLYLC